MRIFSFNGFDIFGNVEIVGVNGGFAYIFGDGDIELSIDRDETFAIGVVEHKDKLKSDILFGITWSEAKKLNKSRVLNLSNNELLEQDFFRTLENNFKTNLIAQLQQK